MFLSAKRIAFTKKVLILFPGVYYSYQLRVSEDFWIAGERYFLQPKWINKFKSKQFYYPACTAWVRQMPKLHCNAHRSPLLFSDSLGRMKWGNSLPFNNPFSLPVPPPSSEFILSRLLPQLNQFNWPCVYLLELAYSKGHWIRLALSLKRKKEGKGFFVKSVKLKFQGPSVAWALGRAGVAGSCSLGVAERKQDAIKKYFWKTA